MPTDELRYTAEHEWVQVVDSDGDTVLRIGITAYAQEALGDIVFVTLPTVGTELTAGQVLGEVESTKSVSDIYAPVSGKVSARNDQLDTSPELVNADPLGAGWMIEIAPAAAVDEVLAQASFLDAEQYAALVDDGA